MKSKKNSKNGQPMTHAMNRVLPGLYIGSYADANDLDQLEMHNITHILSLRSNPKRIIWHPHYLHLPVTDTQFSNIAKYFTVCNNFIQKARLDGPKTNNVLVHCYAGVSRSATVVAAYLMTVADMTWRQALQVLVSVRPIVQPNAMFVVQLRRFQLLGLTTERHRLYTKFPSRVLIAWDHMRTRAILGYDGVDHSRRKCDRELLDSDVYYDCITGDEFDDEF